METVDLTPPPRILRMLGKIDFELWRCVAEMIDNSLDGFCDAERTGQPIAVPTIEIILPKDRDDPSRASIEVNDNGPGMSLETLERSLKAGWSNNDPFGKFGLFGMGFNIATARLGSHTEVLTTQSGDPYWHRITIDFLELERQGTFAAPSDLVEKDHDEESGTKIIVSKLNAQQLRQIGDPVFRTNLHKRLGRVYSRVLVSTRGLSSATVKPLLATSVKVFINGRPVVPRPHCIWSEQRKVRSNNDLVSAVLPLNFALPPRACCRTCWNWLADGELVCSTCQSGGDVQMRSRAITGWIGIQRFGDQNEFGIDFLRNGRKIMTFDRSLFEWEDPITGSRFVEYPVDTLQTFGGRIVGEVDLDHVAVTYQKDAFEKFDPAWREAILAIRGDGPLGPKISQRYGYPPNTSPFALFYSAFRRADPGLRCLRVKNNQDARDWAEKFWEGDPEYQTDEKWYKAAEAYEMGSRGGDDTTPQIEEETLFPASSSEDSLEELLASIPASSSADLPTEMSSVSPASATESPSITPDTPKSQLEMPIISLAPATETPFITSQLDILRPQTGILQEHRIVELSPSSSSSPVPAPAPPPKTERQRLEEESVEDVEFSRSYFLDSKIFLSSHPFTVSVRRLLSGKRLSSSSGSLILKRFTEVNGALIVYDPDHPFFGRFENSVSDILLLEIASLLLAFLPKPPGAETWSLSHAYVYLKDYYDQEGRIDILRLEEEARLLLQELQERSVDLLKDDPQRAYDVLTRSEQESIYRRVLESSMPGMHNRVTLINSGLFLTLTPWSAFPRIVQAWPQPFLDGGFWNYSYQEIDSGSHETDAVLRQQRLERLVNLIQDVVWLTESSLMGGSNFLKNKPHFVRCAQSLRLLRQYKVTV
jgi:hypothetical protein